MNLDDLIITVFCLVDDQLVDLKQQIKWRTRGFAPKMSDAEVITLEIIGEYLGLDKENQLFHYFRRHYSDMFPSLLEIHRTTLTRQMANLWKIKEQLWQSILPVQKDKLTSLVDSFPLSICRFGRANRCKLFEGFAGFGRDHNTKATIYGFRLHVRCHQASGLITRFSIAPANESDLSLLPQLAEQTSGVLLADRNYWSPETQASFKEQGLRMLVPFKQKRSDPNPGLSYYISRHRQLIETVFSQLTQRFSIKHIRARDMWHLSNRIIRKVLAHTIGVVLCQKQGIQPLQLSKLLAI